MRKYKKWLLRNFPKRIVIRIKRPFNYHISPKTRFQGIWKDFVKLDNKTDFFLYINCMDGYQECSDVQIGKNSIKSLPPPALFLPQYYLHNLKLSRKKRDFSRIRSCLTCPQIHHNPGKRVRKSTIQPLRNFRTAVRCLLPAQKASCSGPKIPKWLNSRV